uniref:EF-hand domain-containing protein n=1 Tax=Arcella intermedia TaxID=1963864 RepID=A0A6B2L4F5_9EUKA
MARIVRLVKSLNGLNKIFTTFIRSVPYIINIMTIVLTVYFVFGIIGVSLMGGITFDYTSPGAVNYWANFDNLPNALLTLFRISTFDDWTVLAWSASGYFCTPGPGVVCGSTWYLIYFICFVLIQTNVILNLFLAILIENFTTFQQRDEKVSKIAAFGILKNSWQAVDKKATGFIHVSELVRMLITLGPPLGFHANILQGEIIRELDKMKLHLYEGNKINFYDLLRGLTIRSMKVDLESLDILEIEEFNKGKSGMTVAEYYKIESDKVMNVYTPEEKKKLKNDDFFYQRIKPLIHAKSHYEEDFVQGMKDVNREESLSITPENTLGEEEDDPGPADPVRVAKTEMLVLEKQINRERRVLRRSLQAKAKGISNKLEVEKKMKKRKMIERKISMFVD